MKVCLLPQTWPGNCSRSGSQKAVGSICFGMTGEVQGALASGLQLWNLESCHLKGRGKETQHWCLRELANPKKKYPIPAPGKAGNGEEHGPLPWAFNHLLVLSVRMNVEDRLSGPQLQAPSRWWRTKQSPWAYWGHIPGVEGQIDSVSTCRTVL